MNNKVEIWKRKLAKEKLKQQMKMWDALTKDHSRPKWQDFTFDMDVNSMFPQSIDTFSSKVHDDLAKEMAKQIDDDILKAILGDSKT